MTIPVSFRWDEEFVGRVDEARGDVPRSAWVRRAVERALEGAHRERMVLESARAVVAEPENYPAWAVDAAEQALGSSGRAGVRGRVPAPVPAEQPQDVVQEARALASGVPLSSRVRSSAAARPFRPAPKKGEK